MDFFAGFLSSLELRRAFKVGPVTVTEFRCSECRLPLIEEHFGDRIVHKCDTVGCPLFRSPQEARKSRTSQPGYRRWLERREKKRQERYELCKSLGIGSYRASKLRDRTTIDIREYAKHDN